VARSFRPGRPFLSAARARVTASLVSTGMDLSAAEVRVLGCLIEKQRTTPDVYPLSLNSLRLACNQSTNRDPIVDYDEATVRAALDELARRGWARLASGPGSRAAKFRHLLPEALGLPDGELSLLAVLMLRGDQTLGELKQRTERLHRFESIDAVEATLQELAGRELVARRARRPGQKEDRYAHLLGGAVETVASGPEATPAPGLTERVERLEAEVRELRARLDGSDSG
jgi:uncharacterized protein